MTSALEMSKTFVVDVVSDVVCPWCFIGKRRFEKAVGMFKSQPATSDFGFELHWRPYQLNPSQSEVGQKKLDMYTAKFGKEKVEKMLPHMREVGQGEGIKFSYGGNISNTLKAHKLLTYTLSKYGAQKQNELAEELFSGYHEKEQDPGNKEFLTQAFKNVVSAGTAKEVSDALESAEVKAQVQEEMAQYRSSFGVEGVPFFVVRYKGKILGLISGAQSPESFLKVFNKADPTL